MRILIVSQYFWPEQFLVNSLVSELLKNGHHVEVLTGLPNYPAGDFFNGYSFFKGPWKEVYEAAIVHRVPILSRKKGFVHLFLNYISFVFFAVIICLFKIKKKPDVIFCYAPSPVTSCLPAIFLKWFYRRPLSLWVQDLWPESLSAVGVVKSQFILKCIGQGVRFIYRRCDQLLIQSEAFKASVLQWGGEPSKIHYVPNWAGNLIGEKEPAAWLQQLPSGFKIVFAGNVGKAQDMPTILEAADHVKNKYPEITDIHWVIVGDGSERQFVEEQAKRRSLDFTVHTFGQKPNCDMADLFAKADVLLVTLKDEFIFSLTVPAKIQSYMAAGRPILAGINGEGARLVEKAKAGLICAAQSPSALGEAAVRLYRLGSEEKFKMGKSGQKYFIENFQQEKVVLKIIGLLETLL